jgi:carbon storage regulator CsrA
MLAVSRRREESIIIKDEHGTQVKVKILEFKDDGYGQRVVIGIAAPREWPVYREELLENLDALTTLRAAFQDAPESVQKRFLAEMGNQLLARTTHDMISNFMRGLEKLGLVQVEQRPDGKLVLELGSPKTGTEGQA